MFGPNESLLSPPMLERHSKQIEDREVFFIPCFGRHCKVGRVVAAAAGCEPQPALLRSPNPVPRWQTETARCKS